MELKVINILFQNFSVPYSAYSFLNLYIMEFSLLCFTDRTEILGVTAFEPTALLAERVQNISI